jgi:NADH-quinone oxidoreductase subunit G
MIVLGESLLNLKSSKYFFNKIKNFLFQITKLMMIGIHLIFYLLMPATVGNFDLGLVNEDNNLLEDLQNHKFDIIYLVDKII